MADFTVKDILDKITEMGIRRQWHSYVDVPSSHCFATWNIPSKKISGADFRAYMKEYTLEVVFFYREQKKTSDFEIEYSFENEMKPMGEFTCSTGYDSDNKLFYTQYNFDFFTPIEVKDYAG